MFLLQKYIITAVAILLMSSYISDARYPFTIGNIRAALDVLSISTNHYSDVNHNRQALSESGMPPSVANNIDRRTDVMG